jgi:hypothetical protein
MHLRAERMPGAVTQHESIWLGQADEFAPADRSGNSAQASRPKDVRQAIASHCRHVARALLLC